MLSIFKAVLAVICAVGLAGAAPRPAKPPVYELAGYRFEGILGPQNTAGIIAKLKHQPGAHITDADIMADSALFAKELKARHLTGRFFVYTEQKQDRIWVTFVLWRVNYPQSSGWSSRQLESQHFEGSPGISTDALLRATQLKPGETLSPERVEAARLGIRAILAKSKTTARLTLRIRIGTEPNNKATLTWVIGKPVAATATKVN